MDGNHGGGDVPSDEDVPLSLSPDISKRSEVSLSLCFLVRV